MVMMKYKTNLASEDKYTQEESDIIKSWAISTDYELEEQGFVYGSSKRPITVLEQAKRRKAQVEKNRNQSDILSSTR